MSGVRFATRLTALGLAAACAALSGCAADHYLSYAKWETPPPFAVEELQRFPRDKRATAVLAELVGHEDRSVRCAALIAVREHWDNMDCAMRHQTLLRCVAALQDVRSGWDERPAAMSRVLFFLPGGKRVFYGSVRAQALVTLTSHLVDRDYGFDIDEWTRCIDAVYPAGDASPMSDDGIRQNEEGR